MSVRPIGKVRVTQSDVQPKATTAALTTKITVTGKVKQVSPSSLGSMMLGWGYIWDHIKDHSWVHINDHIWVHIWWYYIWVTGSKSNQVPQAILSLLQLFSYVLDYMLDWRNRATRSPNAIFKFTFSESKKGWLVEKQVPWEKVFMADRFVVLMSLALAYFWSSVGFGFGYWVHVWALEVKSL